MGGWVFPPSRKQAHERPFCGFLQFLKLMAEMNGDIIFVEKIMVLILSNVIWRKNTD